MREESKFCLLPSTTQHCNPKDRGKNKIQVYLILLHLGGIAFFTNLSFVATPCQVCGSNGKESASNARGLGLIPGLGRSCGGGHGNPLQDSCLEKLYEQRRLTGCSPYDHKEVDITEPLSAQHVKQACQ